MTREKFDELPKHTCIEPGVPSLGFAPLDYPVMVALVARNAGSDEIAAQVKDWLTSDASKNPNSPESSVKRFQAAMLSNNPFAVYCALCLEPICLISPGATAPNRKAMTETANTKS